MAADVTGELALAGEFDGTTVELTTAEMSVAFPGAVHIATITPKKSGTLRLYIRGAAAEGAAPSFVVRPGAFNAAVSQLVGDGATAAVAGRDMQISSTTSSDAF